MVAVFTQDLQRRATLRRRKWPKWFHQLAGVLVESRPAVQVVFVLRSLAGSGVLRHPTLHRVEEVLGWTLLTVAIYVFNGITDVVGDSTNGSRRPIASGKLASQSATLWCVCLAVAGMALCSRISTQEAGLAGAMLALGWAYSSGPCLKNRPTGFALTIGAGAGLTYVAGWGARGGHAGVAVVVVTLLVASWVGVCCGAKDFSDVDGDRVAGRRTWPVVLGPARASRLLAALAVSGALGALTATVVMGASLVPAVVLLAGSIMVAVASLRCAAATGRDVRRRPYRLFIATQYLTNLALIILDAG